MGRNLKQMKFREDEATSYIGKKELTVSPRRRKRYENRPLHNPNTRLNRRLAAFQQHQSHEKCNLCLNLNQIDGEISEIRIWIYSDIAFKKTALFSVFFSGGD